jgi:hypothetical protein
MLVELCSSHEDLSRHRTRSGTVTYAMLTEKMPGHVSVRHASRVRVCLRFVSATLKSKIHAHKCEKT